MTLHLLASRVNPVAFVLTIAWRRNSILQLELVVVAKMKRRLLRTDGALSCKACPPALEVDLVPSFWVLGTLLLARSLSQKVTDILGAFKLFLH